MSDLERPKLRNLNVFPVEMNGKRMICLQDPLHFTENPVFVPENAFFIVSLFDGEHSILDIQEQFMRRYGTLIMSDQIRKVVNDLDTNLMLESDRFEEYKRYVAEDFANSTIRLSAFAGRAYESDPELLKEQLNSYFTHPEGPGEPNFQNNGSIRGIVAPHIDLQRGGICYAWAYKEIAEHSNADLFIIFGTSHTNSKNPFIITKKDFQTPLGILSTDKDFVQSIEGKCKFNIYEDELIHKYEHSIEFQTVFLQYILGERRDFQIVPILCSPFNMENGKLPTDIPEINDFISILRDSISISGRSICFISGADLSHIGKRFGDNIAISSGLLDLIETKDLQSLKYVENLDADGFFRFIQEENNNRKICGLSSIYTMLKVMDANKGQLIKYYQSPEYDTDSVVTFASLSFS
ncbi:MAG: AmmeMemoRadiSam system protein B [Candidatus Poribacteria bacterium]